MDVPTTMLSEASDRFSIDPFLGRFSRGSCCWETRVWPDQLDLNF